MSYVYFHDRFDTSAIPWKVTAGTGTVARTTTDAEVHSYGGAMKLTTSTVAAEATEVHRFHARVPDTPTVVFGGRFAIMDENISNVAFYLGYRDGATWYRAKMLHVYTTNVWQYDAGGSGGASNVTLLTRDPAEVSSRGIWHTFALAADFTALTYKSFVIDDQVFSATVNGVALRSSSDTASPYLIDFAIETTNLGGSPTAGVVIFDELYGVGIGSTNSDSVLTDARSALD